jgi:hypothetical protein
VSCRHVDTPAARSNVLKLEAQPAFRKLRESRRSTHSFQGSQALSFRPLRRQNDGVPLARNG